MIYKVHDVDTVVDAVYTVRYEILEDFEGRYGQMFTEPCSLNVREILIVDYNCPADVAEQAMQQLDQMGILEYQEPL